MRLSGSRAALPSDEHVRRAQGAEPRATGAALTGVSGRRKTDRARQSTPSTEGPETTVGEPLTVPGPVAVPGVNDTRSSAPVVLLTYQRFPAPRKAPPTCGRETPGAVAATGYTTPPSGGKPREYSEVDPPIV